jgi:hypothetical protein
MPEPSILGVLGMIWIVFKYTWWIFLPLGLYSVFRPLWASYTANILFFGGEAQMTLFEIKIPKEMVVSIKAMENVFTGLLAAGKTITKYENIIFGRLQDMFSLEIIGQEGQVRFFALCPKRSISLLHRSLYAQFPEIEIKPVTEDYFNLLPSTVPDENWDMYGAKMVLANEDCKPLNTYPMMEDRIEGEIIDPLSIMYEAMGNLGPGEFLIYQVHIAIPSDDSWRKKGRAFIEDILKKYNIGVQADYDEEGPSFRTLPPHELELVKAVSAKINKPAFNTQIILAYVARKEVYDGIMPSAIAGALRMTESDDNALITDKYYSTTTRYLFSKGRNVYRKRRLFRLLLTRDIHTANTLNVEELATIFHFPPPMTKMPSVQRLDSKTAPAPSNLPVAE